MKVKMKIPNDPFPLIGLLEATSFFSSLAGAVLVELASKSASMCNDMRKIGFEISLPSSLHSIGEEGWRYYYRFQHICIKVCLVMRF